jgi:hypothetical protein
VVSDAGVVPALRLGESAGLYGLLEEALTAGSPNATAKTAGVVGGMLADADSIDDLETRVEVNRGGPGNPLSLGLASTDRFSVSLTAFGGN